MRFSLNQTLMVWVKQFNLLLLQEASCRWQQRDKPPSAESSLHPVQVLLFWTKLPDQAVPSSGLKPVLTLGHMSPCLSVLSSSRWRCRRPSCTRPSGRSCGTLDLWCGRPESDRGTEPTRWGGRWWLKTRNKIKMKTAEHHVSSKLAAESCSWSVGTRVLGGLDERTYCLCPAWCGCSPPRRSSRPPAGPGPFLCSSHTCWCWRRSGHTEERRRSHNPACRLRWSFWNTEPTSDLQLGKMDTNRTRSSLEPRSLRSFSSSSFSK